MGHMGDPREGMSNNMPGEPADSGIVIVMTYRVYLQRLKPMFGHRTGESGQPGEWHLQFRKYSLVLR